MERVPSGGTNEPTPVRAIHRAASMLRVFTGAEPQLSLGDLVRRDLDVVGICAPAMSPVGHRSGIYPSCLGRAALSGLDPAELEPTLADWSCPQLTPATRTDREDVLASIEDARRSGYAIDAGEYLEGTAGVAVPLAFDRGRPRAALGVVGPAGRLSEERLRALGETLRELTASRLRAEEGTA